MVISYYLDGLSTPGSIPAFSGARRDKRLLARSGDITVPQTAAYDTTVTSVAMYLLRQGGHMPESHF